MLKQCLHHHLFSINTKKGSSNKNIENIYIAAENVYIPAKEEVRGLHSIYSIVYSFPTFIKFQIE